MAFDIRKIGSADLAAIVLLIREFAEYDGHLDVCEVNEERLAASMFGEDAFLEGLISFDVDAIVGYALFCPHFSSFVGEPGLFVEDLYIRSEFRGRGAGSDLLAEIARIARDRGFGRIDFLVDCSNEPAIAFYKSLGAETNPEERRMKFIGPAFLRLASR